MSKFVFKLEKFLSIKEKLEEKSKIEYGKALLILENEKKELQNLEEKKEATILEFEKDIKFSIKPNRIFIVNNFLKLIDKQIIDKKKEVEEAYEFSEVKRLELLESIKDKKKFSNLKEKHKEDYLLEEIKIEQKIIDEVVTYKYKNNLK